jgi:hypothetical protein
MESMQSSDEEDEDSTSVQACARLTDVYELAIKYDVPEWAARQLALDGSDITGQISAKYRRDRFFVEQLLEDSFLCNTLTELQNPDNTAIFNDYGSLPDPTQSALLTLYRAFENRFDYITCLVDYIMKIYPFRYEHWVVAGILRSVLREIETVLRLLPFHIKTFSGLKVLIDRLKEQLQTLETQVRPT